MALHHITDLWHSQRLVGHWSICVCVGGGGMRHQCELMNSRSVHEEHSNSMSSVLLPIPRKYPAENPFAVCSVAEQCVLTECSAQSVPLCFPVCTPMPTMAES